MAKLTKTEHKAHEKAEALLNNGRDLTSEEIDFVFNNWHPGADSNQTAASAYFTPVAMAQDFRLECAGRGVLLDLCAGIGILSYYGSGRHMWEQYRPEYEAIICVERNPRFVEVGKRLFPAAHWICGDAMDPETWAEIRAIAPRIDFAICNPPFGRTTKSFHKAPRYCGAEGEFQILDVAMMFAPSGAAIIPRMSAPFDTVHGYARRPSSKYRKFEEATGASLHGGIGIACDLFRDDWKGVAPAVEIVTWDFADYDDSPKPINAHPKQEAPKAKAEVAQLAFAL